MAVSAGIISFGTSLLRAIAGKNGEIGAGDSIVLGGTGIDAVNVGVGLTIPKRTLEVNGGFATSLVKSTGTGAITPDNTVSVFYIVTAVSSLTFPIAGSCTNKRNIIVNRTGASIPSSQYDNFNGAASASILSNSSVEVISDGTAWLQIK